MSQLGDTSAAGPRSEFEAFRKFSWPPAASRLSYLLLNPALSEEASVVIVTPVLRLQNFVSENLLENDDKY